MSLIPVEAFPEHLANVRDINDPDTLKSLIIVADQFIESMDTQINELAQDAARYKVLFKLLPYMIVEAVEMQTTESAESIIARMPVLETYIDDLIAAGLTDLIG